MIWWLVALGVVITVIASGALDDVGWVFYHATMRQAARKREQREMLRAGLDAAMAEYRTVPPGYLESLHAHAHTMASLTGQPVLVSGERYIPLPSAGFLHAAGGTSVVHYSGSMITHYGGGGGGSSPAPVHEPEMILPVRRYGYDDPRHFPWTLPPS